MQQLSVDAASKDDQDREFTDDKNSEEQEEEMSAENEDEQEGGQQDEAEGAIGGEPQDSENDGKCSKGILINIYFLHMTSFLFFSPNVY